MDPTIHGRFMALLRDESLAEPSWIVGLDEFDEAPLFSRSDQVEFLRSLPHEQRIAATLEIALETMEMVAKEAGQCAPDRMYFLCVTLSDFDLWRTGEQLVPTPAIYANPNEENTSPSGVWLVEPWSVEGGLVARILSSLGRDYSERYCVGELDLEFFDSDNQRVYIGWRSNPVANVRSVGDDIARGRSERDGAG